MDNRLARAMEIQAQKDTSEAVAALKDLVADLAELIRGLHAKFDDVAARNPGAGSSATKPPGKGKD